MARERISAKYLGDGSTYYNGIPAKDLTEAEFDALPDEAKAKLAEQPPEGVKPLYELRYGAPDAAEAASARVAEAPAEVAPPVVPDGVDEGSEVADSKPRGKR